MKKIQKIFVTLALALLIPLVGIQGAAAQLFYVPGSGNSSTGTGTTQPTTSACLTFSTNLSIGMRDVWSTDISKYQTFLISYGYLSPGLATGYFGSLSFAATRRFQAANGISATGFVGPLTRAKISALTCGQVNPPNPTAPVITSLSPSSGPFGTLVTIYGRGFTQFGNSINFGGVNGIRTNVYSYDGVSLQFTIPISPCPQGSQVCTMIAYAPGQFPLSVSNSGGTSNSLIFTATDQNSGNIPPTISGVNGPSNLPVGQSGTWSVQASDPTGQGLSYQAVWGDESQVYGNSYYASQNTYIQSATFNHTYTQPGTYTPTFTVRSANGFTAQTSLTVVVTGQSNIAPTITSISPSSGPYGTTMTITGTNFSYYNSVNFAGVNNTAVNVPSYDGRTLQFTIPATPCSSGSYCAQVALQPGTYPISVTTQNSTTNTMNFTLTSGSNYSTTTINQSVTLSLGQTATLNDLEIKPISIVEDSRCAIGTTCIWAGRVVVQTILKTNIGETTLNMAVNDEYTVNGYRVKITDVTPSRYANQTINNDQYRITYQIIK